MQKLMEKSDNNKLIKILCIILISIVLCGACITAFIINSKIDSAKMKVIVNSIYAKDGTKVNIIAGKEQKLLVAAIVNGKQYINKTNTVNLTLTGTDDNYSSNSLTADNIVVKVGENVVTPTTKTLGTPTDLSSGKGVEYPLTLSGIPGDGTLEIEVAKDTLTDKAVNKNILTKIDLEIIVDNSAPITGTMTMKLESSTGSNYTNNSWTNRNVYVAVNNGSDTGSGHKSTTYTIFNAAGTTIGESTTTIAQTISVTGNYTIQVTTIDNTGNISKNTYYVKIDKAAPTISVSPSTNTVDKSTNIKILVGESGGSGLLSTNSYQYQLGTSNTTAPIGTWTTYSSASTGTMATIGSNLTGTYYLWVKEIKDVAGNTNTVGGTKVSTYNVFGPYVFDNTPPSLNSIAVTSPSAGTYKVGQVITLVSTYSENIYGGSNKAGITATTAPILKVKFGSSAERTAIFNSVSGSKVTYTYTIANGDNGTLAVTGYTGTVYDIVANTLAVGIKAISGNTIIADTVTPTLNTIKATNASGIYKEGTTLTIQTTWSENIYSTADKITITSSTAPILKLKFGSGIERTASFMGISGKVITYTYKITKEDNGLLIITGHNGSVYDIAGNKTTVNTTTSPGNTGNVIKADTILPEWTVILEEDVSITITPSTTKWTNKDIIISINYGEFLTNNRKIGYATTLEQAQSIAKVSEMNSITVSENGYIYVEATDSSSNKTSKSLQISNIDKEIPITTIDAIDGTSIIKGTKVATASFKFAVNVEDKGNSLINTVQYAWSNSGTVQPTNYTSTTSGKIITESKEVGIYYLWAKSTDNAGNVSPISITKYSIGGWKSIGTEWYYYSVNTGLMLKGQWVEVGTNHYYYLKEDGKMARGWLVLDGYYYYLYNDIDGGERLTGWQNIDGNWYYFEDDGKMATGWKSLGGYWYYLKPLGSTILPNVPEGSMLHDVTVTIDGTSYKFDSDGHWV